jgi:uncharacterized membrane protein YkgB
MWSKPRQQDKPEPTDYRKTRRRQEQALLWLVIFMLVVVGTGLIGLIWGAWQALQGGLCLLGGAALIAGLWFLLNLIQTWLEE